MFLHQATRGPASECARRLQLQLPGGGQAEAGQAGERGEQNFDEKEENRMRKGRVWWEKESGMRLPHKECLWYSCHGTMISIYYAYITHILKGITWIWHLLLQFGDDSEVVEGTYSYLTPEGEEVEVSYTANENGYFPTVRFVNPNHLHCPDWSTIKQFLTRLIFLSFTFHHTHARCQ